MIADVFKFIEYVQKIETIPVAKALFLLYFPSNLKNFNSCQFK